MLQLRSREDSFVAFSQLLGPFLTQNEDFGTRLRSVIVYHSQYTALAQVFLLPPATSSSQDDRTTVLRQLCLLL